MSSLGILSWDNSYGGIVGSCDTCEQFCRKSRIVNSERGTPRILIRIAFHRPPSNYNSMRNMVKGSRESFKDRLPKCGFSWLLSVERSWKRSCDKIEVSVECFYSGSALNASERVSSF